MPQRWEQNALATHTLIEGDNLVVMRALADRGERFDVIYMDPPYGSGGNRVYANPPAGPHWQRFIEDRVTVARDLLEPTGVLLFSIGDKGLVDARLAIEKAFGTSAHVATLVWEGGVARASTFVSATHDYLLIYARNQVALREAGPWRELKPGVARHLEVAAQLAADHPQPQAQKLWRAHLRAAKTDSAIARYDRLGSDGRPWRSVSLGSSGPSEFTYEVLHPVTGRPCAMPPRGWRMKEDRFRALLDEGLVLFGEDETKQPERIYFLEEMQEQTPSSVFQQERGRASRHVANLLGLPRSPFPHPKDHEVLARWFHLATGGSKSARFLDAFGGSGSAVEAVMLLNARDDGARRATLVTLDEGAGTTWTRLEQLGVGLARKQLESGYFESVTVARLQSAASGLRPDGSRWGRGYPGQKVRVKQLGN